MYRSKLRFLFTIALALAGCATTQKDTAFMTSADYQNRSPLTQSLVGANESFTEAAVQKILSSKVVLPKAINLAIVRLDDARGDLDFQMIDDKVNANFYDVANWGPRVKSVTPVPQVMIAKPVTLTTLRIAAVLLQADALLIIKPASYADWKHQWFEENKGKAVTSLEVLLLDTRTSVVPYTSLITESVEIGGEQNDYSNLELMRRAKQASEAKALMRVPANLRKFISTAL